MEIFPIVAHVLQIQYQWVNAKSYPIACERVSHSLVQPIWNNKWYRTHSAWQHPKPERTQGVFESCSDYLDYLCRTAVLDGLWNAFITDSKEYPTFSKLTQMKVVFPKLHFKPCGHCEQSWLLMPTPNYMNHICAIAKLTEILQIGLFWRIEVSNKSAATCLMVWETEDWGAR